MALSSLGIWFAFGGMLGLCYRVLILCPAIGLALLAAAVVGIARGDHVTTIALAMILAGAALQIGYLGGVVMR